MNDTFNTPKKRSEVIAAAREIISETGLFAKKKKYALLVYDNEGKREDVEGKDGKLKAKGLDLRRSDTPKNVQEFLTDILMQTLRLNSEDEVIKTIREFKKVFAELKPWEKGAPTAVNNLTLYRHKLERRLERKLAHKSVETLMVPGHVMASINWNALRASHNDLQVTKIVDGQKVMVCKLKEANDLNKKSVAFSSPPYRLLRLIFFTSCRLSQKLMIFFSSAGLLCRSFRFLSKHKLCPSMY